MGPMVKGHYGLGQGTQAPLRELPTKWLHGPGFGSCQTSSHSLQIYLVFLGSESPEMALRCPQRFSTVSPMPDLPSSAFPVMAQVPAACATAYHVPRGKRWFHHSTLAKMGQKGSDHS